ncbi:hypothetical protein BDB00DRAFT_875090 [Zychaea mexicana]|uniref:uncharacterized protein n=1 Tax=Zychaea mexicana TaxID=64656 RepID=UPI0022FDC631|nr:uncharacterized protein BDB00DRAFT_875090 [Zychaea mexicana]KAI9490625.1 hypothetical protein BDB00DRAFT_875090 [Zychaea mexicana]
MHLITLFVSVFITLAFIGVDYTLANCDCDPTSHGCLDRCINEARSCIADCNTRALGKNSDEGSCRNQCLQRYWPEIDVDSKVNPQNAVEEEDTMFNSNVDEKPELVEEEDNAVADEGDEAALNQQVEVNVEEEQNDIKTPSIAEEEEQKQEENEMDGAEMSIDEENLVDDEDNNDADLMEENVYEGYSSDEQLAPEEDDHEEEDDREEEDDETEELAGGNDATTNDQQQHRNNIFAVISSHKKENHDDEQQETEDDEEYHEEVTQDETASGEKAAPAPVDAYFDSNPAESGTNGQPNLLTVTAYSTMTSHVTVMPNGSPISTHGPSHGPDGMDVDINGAVGNMQSSSAIVILMAMACAYFIA